MPRVKLKECNTCHKPKDANKDFYKSMGKCKPCYNDHVAKRKQSRDEDAGVVPRRAAKVAVATRSGAAADEFVIPAAGVITCRVIEVLESRTYLLQQGAHPIYCSPEQLQLLLDWASTQLKARS